MQGVNTFGKHHTVIIVGRLQPRMEIVEAQMRALCGDGDTPLAFLPPGPGWMAPVDSARLMADDSLGPAKIRTHPDPRGAALLRQSREAASLQAIARIRAVTAAEAKRIVVLCSIPLADLPVTELAPWNALVAGADPATARSSRVCACRPRGCATTRPGRSAKRPPPRTGIARSDPQGSCCSRRRR
jgi:hypothetical protein